ncbi:MAG TPA: flagellar export protein FliJ, partial [Candidatus Paceibacterota bacterium]|nr:flagellar export protein FliJ [Candidatus Paceibacterota bacterium]
MKKIHSTLAEHVSWYGKWHNNKHHSVAHYAILIAFIGTLSFGIASTIQVPQSEAQEVKQLKEELTAKNQEFSAAVMLYAQAQGTEQRARANTLKEIAQRRSDSMTLAAANDPQAFIEHVLPEAVKAHMPADVLALVEAKTKMEGTLVIIHTDTPGEGTYQTTLETKGGKAYTVHTAGGSLKKISDGSTVSIEGYVLGYQLVTADASAATVLAAAPVNSSVGEQKTLVMLVNFSDNPTQPWTPAQVNTMYFGTPTENPQSLNSYYRENSYNQTWYTGAVAGWFTIEKSQLSSICSMTDLQTVIDPLAAAAGFDISAYGHKVYMYPTTYCTGLSTVGAFPSRSLVPKAGSTDVGTYQMMYHELGHALGKGRQHARMELCGTKQIDVAANCTFTEYGDPYDVMGASQSTDTTLSLITNTRLFNALGRILLSWIPPVRVQTITTDGVYTLSSLETAQSSGTQVFKIYKADSSGGSDFITYSAEPLKSYYYLSYRQPYGTFDGNLPNYVTGGTSVHADSAVLDGTAGDGNNFNTAILDNMSFIDDVNKITVTQLSHTSSTATIQVAFTPGFCPWPPLFLNTVGVLNNQPVQPGGQVAFTYGVTGSEDPRCGTNTFAL